MLSDTFLARYWWLVNSNLVLQMSNSSMFFKCRSSNEWSYLLQQSWSTLLCVWDSQSKASRPISSEMGLWITLGTLTPRASKPGCNATQSDPLKGQWGLGPYVWQLEESPETMDSYTLPSRSVTLFRCLVFQVGWWLTEPCLPEFLHFSTECLSSWETSQSWAKWN